MKTLKFVLIFTSLLCFKSSYAQQKSTDEELCTLTTAIWLPVKLGVSSVSCAAIVTTPNPLSAIGCGNLVNVLINPNGWWEGNVKNCKVALKETREGKYIKAVITVTGQRKNAEKIIDAFNKTK